MELVAAVVPVVGLIALLLWAQGMGRGLPPAHVKRCLAQVVASFVVFVGLGVLARRLRGGALLALTPGTDESGGERLLVGQITAAEITVWLLMAVCAAVAIRAVRQVNRDPGPEADSSASDAGMLGE